MLFAKFHVSNQGFSSVASPERVMRVTEDESLNLGTILLCSPQSFFVFGYCINSELVNFAKFYVLTFNSSTSASFIFLF